MTEQTNEIKYIELGSSTYPIPVGLKKSKTGEVIGVEWLSDDDNAIYIPTMQQGSQNELYGMFVRKVVTDPVLLKSMTGILERLNTVTADKTEKGSSVTIIGDPGAGKTYMTSRISELLHPKGAFQVDCHLLEEAKNLYQITSVNVGEHDKISALEAYIERANSDATMQDTSFKQMIAKLKSSFGNSYITERTVLGTEDTTNKKIYAIDFEGIKNERSAKYIEQVLQEVIEKNNIPYERNTGSLGIAYLNGPLLQALVDKKSEDYGRPLILDEENRIAEGEAWLTIKAFFSDPNVKQIELRGEDDHKFIIRRQDIPENFMLMGTANPATEEMGSSAQSMSRPMISRSGANIDIIQSGRAEEVDYISRAMKHFTGVPAYLLYLRDPKYYDENPKELSEDLMHLRTIGLTEEEKKLIPEDEIYNIKHIDKTLYVAKHYGALLYEASSIIEEASKDISLPERYTEYLKNEAIVDLRYLYKLYEHSQLTTPKKGTTQFKSIASSSKDKTDENVRLAMEERILARKKGKKYSRGDVFDKVVVEKLVDLIRPDNINDLIREDEEPQETIGKINGLVRNLTEKAQEHKFENGGYVDQPDTIAKTFNIKDEELTDKEKEIARILVEGINAHSNKDFKPENINGRECLEELDKLIKESKGIVVPTLDLSKTENFENVSMLNEEAENNEDNLVYVEQFIRSMMIDQSREHNIDCLMEKSKQMFSEEEKENDGIRIASGEHEELYVSVVKLQEKREETGAKSILNHIGSLSSFNRTRTPEKETAPVLAIVIHNKKTKKTGVLSTFEITEQTAEDLKNKNITFLKAKDCIEKADTEIVNDFLENMVTGTDCKKENLSHAMMYYTNKMLAEFNEGTTNPKDIVTNICLSARDMKDSDEISNKDLIKLMQNRRER